MMSKLKMSKLDEIFIRVLNDKDIFWIEDKIFNESEWEDLKKKINDKKEIVEKTINEKSKSLKKSQTKEQKVNEQKVSLIENLQECLNDRPYLFIQKLKILKCFGLVKCNLPNMDDFGKVIERYSQATVEQFFLEKISRENNVYRKRALQKVLEYVKELYSANVSLEEISYFVRKLNLLKTFWEV